ncbi:MAG: Flp pilus assembly protein CpaB [Caulobacter sp.]|nr:Flp pilus assembly protein CpaB [Caulobacter sp.]
MSAVRLLILAVAAIAAIALAFVVRGAFSPKTAPSVAAAAPTPSGPTVRVLVAKRDLPTGARLAPTDLGWQDWPAEGLSEAFTTDGAPPQVKPAGAAGAAKEAAATASGLFGDAAIKALDGAVVREPFVSGEPIVARKIVKTGEGNFMAIVLAPGMRAMSVGVTVDTAAGGFILPGDRVDLIVSQNDGDKVVTETVLGNVKVLAIDQAAQPTKDAQTMVGAVATLEVSAADTELVASAQTRARAGGALSLALRSYADAGAPTTRGVSSGSPRAGETVRVVRAGQSSQVTVSR